MPCIKRETISFLCLVSKNTISKLNRKIKRTWARWDLLNPLVIASFSGDSRDISTSNSEFNKWTSFVCSVTDPRLHPFLAASYYYYLAFYSIHTNIVECLFQNVIVICNIYIINCRYSSAIQ